MLIASLLFAFCSCIPTHEEQPDDQSVTFRVTYTAGEGGRIVGQTEQTVEKGKNATSVTAVANDGYKFEKWSDGLTSSTRQDRNVQASVTLNATFTKMSTVIPQPNPQSKTFDVDYKFGVVDKLVTKVTFSRDKVSETDLPVPTREHFAFGGWYLGETQVADEQGAILVGNEIIDSDETVIYAKWTVNETFTYKILLVYVTRVDAQLRNMTDTKTIHVDYTMSEVERRLCHAITGRLERLLEDMLDGLVDFQIDEYYTQETINADNIKRVSAPSASYKFSYSLMPENIPEVSELLADYDSTLAVFSLNSNTGPHDFLDGSGSGGPRTGWVSFDSILFETYLYGVDLEEAIACMNDDKDMDAGGNFNVLGSWFGTFIHELAHTIELRVDLYSYHNAVLPSCTVGNPLGINKEYFLCEIPRDGIKIGIPYEFWARKIARVKYFVTTGQYGIEGSVRVESMYLQHTWQKDKDGNTYYEALYGRTLTLTASPMPGYKFTSWSDGVTTSTRTDTITGDMTLTAMFELAEYTITVYPSEGGTIYGYYYLNGTKVVVDNTSFTATVKPRGDICYIAAYPNEGYRFVGWSNGVTKYGLDFDYSSNPSFTDWFDETYTLTLTPIFERID